MADDNSTPWCLSHNGLCVREQILAAGAELRGRHPGHVSTVVVLGGALTHAPSHSAGSRLFCQPAGYPYRLHAVGEGARVLIICAEQDYLAQRIGHPLEAAFRLDNDTVSVLGARVFEELSHPDAYASLHIEAAVLELFAYAFRTVRRSDPALVARWLRDVQAYLNEHFHEQPDVEALAKLAGVRATRLAEVFREKLGCSVGDYLRSRRLEFVVQRLASSQMPLSHVAVEAGFYDQSHLTRVFKRHTGMTPGRYRNVMQQRSSVD